MTTSEMPCVIDTSKIPSNGLELKLDATPAQKEKIAERLGIIRLSELKSRVLVTKDTFITVHASFTAQVIQKDVVTNEALPQTINESFDEVFIEKKDLKEPFSENDLDAPEVIENHQLDIGELIIQYLSLSLDDFPSERADFVYREKEENPFSVLKKLKKD